MSLANVWEITEEDVHTILEEHGVVCDLDDPRVTEALAAIRPRANEVSLAVLDYGDFEEQSRRALEATERLLADAGLVTGPRRFAVGEQAR